ncbi:HC-toxin synthetase [Penicillium coprophilum]|uniref:HC-toxin synthetase n=1 Tax=Penicillium coprophilum TaxID=36646 RepID=UPI002388598E|nr:HC-toxin synthetase [Penicillium coprophilum]KAJ5165554.1 HC-toxin synthetase [Penicillium coprophilum]
MTVPSGRLDEISSENARACVQNIRDKASNIDSGRDATRSYEIPAIESRDKIAPFTLLCNTGLSPGEARARTAEQCNVPEDMVEDVFPCTPLQEGMMATTIKRPGQYVRRWVFRLAKDVMIDRLVQTWDEIVAQHPILRTRIIQIPGQTMLQAILAYKPPRSITTHQGIDQYIAEDDTQAFRLGTPLVRPGLVIETHSDHRCFVLTMHHAIIDGVSIVMLLKEIEVKFHQNLCKSTSANDEINVPFQSFVKHQMDTESEAVKYWEQKLRGSDSSIFPKLPSHNYDPKANEILEYRMTEVPRVQKNDIRLSTAVWAAWTILQASYTHSLDVVFGVPLTGRQQIPIAGVEKMMAPTVVTVPLQVRLDWNASLGTLLQEVQTQITNMLPFAHVGLQKIRQMGPSGDQASRFQTILGVQRRSVVQPGNNSIFQYDSERSARDLGVFNANALMIECQIDTDGLHLLMSFDSVVIRRDQVLRLAQQLENVLRQICTKGSQFIELRRIETLSPQDVGDIRRVDRYVHDLIAEHVNDRPEAPAICAWDGNLTYRELDDLSNRLALYLVEIEVCRGKIVPLCCERSKWTFVCMLAVMKTGAAFVFLDEALPLERMREVVAQTKAQVLLTSKNSLEKASKIRVPLVVMAGAGADWLKTSDVPVQTHFETLRSHSSTGTPGDSLYIAFTSGSTGKPKGAVITHSSYASVACAHKGPMGLNQDSRMLHFASYSFDASNFEALTTFIAGGCLCIPSEEMRKNDLSTVITELQVNSMFLTPTVSRLLTPGDIPTVKVMLLGGEPIMDSDIEFWSSRLHLKIVYGPTECSAICCCLPDATNSDAGTIGHGTGASLWVVDPSDHHKLAPVGAIGELILEGPVVGNGYLNNADKTALAFVDQPDWVSNILHQPYDESFSWYRTGDLVQYREDGLLRYIGRKDQQVKLHGQRFELAEVEIHLRNVWKEAKDVVAAIVTPAGGKTALAAFIWLEKSPKDLNSMCKEIFARTVPAQFSSHVHEARDQLQNLIPSYMVPSLFIPLYFMPQRVSGKIDKALLCSHAATFTRLELETFMGTQLAKRQASTWIEKMIVGFVQDLLKNNTTPSPNDNFFRLGGDSIVAMKLVQLVRRAKMTLNIAEIFQSPKLCDLALLIERRHGNVRPASSSSSSSSSTTPSPSLTSSSESSHISLPQLAPFSMVSKQVQDEVFEEVLCHCGLSPEEVEDIYPCTPLQEGLMSLSIGNPGTYIRQDRYLLPPTIDAGRVKDAWYQVINANTILRTRIYHPRSGEKALQIVLKTAVEWKSCEVESLAGILPSHFEKNSVMGFLDPLLQLTLIKERQGDPNMTPSFLLEVTLHHAIYDALSIEQIYDQVEASYRGIQVYSRSFAPFVEHIERSILSGKLFWSTQLDGAMQSITLFPALPDGNYVPRPMEKIESSISILPDHRQIGYTLNIQLRAAWAMTMFQYTCSNDVVFGVTVAGRSGDLPGLDQVTGPTFATIPLRATRDESKTVQETLSLFQSQMVEAIPFEHYGLQNICSVSEDAALACRFQTLLIIQSAAENQNFNRGERMIFSSPMAKSPEEKSQSDSYALTIECAPRGDSITVRAIFDSTLVPVNTVKQMLQLFSHVFHELIDLTRSIGEINMISAENRSQISTWNSTLSESSRVKEVKSKHTVYDLIQHQCDTHPSDLAVCAWDGNFTYEQLGHQSSIFAAHLLQTFSIGPEVIVPLCFEKSRWTTVAMLGVMKAGAAFVLLDPSSQPVHRMQGICMQVNATFVVCSRANASNFEHIPGMSAIILDREIMATMQSSKHPTLKHIGPVPSYEDALYAVFTSGSTGQPKGIIIEHGGYATTALARQSVLGLHRGSRVLQFASYAFDVSIENTLDTLIAGGCVCIPSESQRKADFARIADEFQVTYADLTPSVARLLSPSDIPTVEIMVLGGETMASEDVSRWANQVRLVNAYGPAECTVTATVKHVTVTSTSRNEDAINIGRAFPTAGTWVVDQFNHNKLLPIGITGELVIEGPLVARGYLDGGNETSRSTSFLQDPPAWRSQFSSSIGPMCSRMYCTGDLVQYNADGSLKYLGRKDQQVKIHGQRIELGEIESQLRAAFPSAIDVLVDMAATIKNPRPSLISFVSFPCTQEEIKSCGETMILLPEPDFQKRIAEAEVKLHELLAQYMIPTVFIPVRNIPQTSSGKADRRKLCQAASNLSLKQIESCMTSQDKARAPSTAIEKRLQALWAKALGVPPESINSSDGFFRVGGNSILAMKLAGLAKLEGISLSVPDLFENKSLEALAFGLESSAHVEAETTAPCFDWDLEATIPQSLDDELQLYLTAGFHRQNQPGACDTGIEIVLTGSTGHLGGEILRQLVARADVRCVHCVAVRRPDQLAIPTWSSHDNFDWKTLFDQKVKVYQGNLSMPRIGLSDDEEATILSNCRAVIHCGALVSFVRSYELMRDVNVGSTKYLAGLAVKGSMVFHFISTVGVNCAPWSEQLIIEETSAADTRPPSDGAGGYIASKWVSEVFLARVNTQYGLPVSIHRPSNVVGPNASKDDIINSLLNTCRQLGMVPRLPGWSGYFDLISVEAAASNIISAMNESIQMHHNIAGIGSVEYRHESGGAVIPIGALKSVLEKTGGRPIRLVDLNEWMEHARCTVGTSELVLEYLEMRKGKGISMPLIRNNRTAWFSGEFTTGGILERGKMSEMKGRGMVEQIAAR